MSTLNKDEQLFCTQLPSSHGAPLPRANHLPTARENTWPRDTTALRFRFLGGSDILQDKFRQCVDQFRHLVNFDTIFVPDGDADIRVSFNQEDACWSYIGTGSKSVTSQANPTLNLPLNDSDSDETTTGAILHALGHAVGFVHEHQNPTLGAGVPWDTPKVHQYYANNYGWSKETFSQNVLDHYGEDVTDYPIWDPHSIMRYAIPVSFTTNGFSIGRNPTLTEVDLGFIRKIYPTN